MNAFVYNLVYDTLYITAYTKLLFHATIALLRLNCAINMDENFSLDEIEQREIEEVAQVVHADIISVYVLVEGCVYEKDAETHVLAKASNNTARLLAILFAQLV